MSYKVMVEKGYLDFGASHFITFGGKCERLHGHNYAVAVEVEGTLTADSYVWDFVPLKQMVKEICKSLDHRFLLAMDNPHLSIQERPGEWEISYGEKRYVLPNEDVLPLPLDNITAERLAEYICQQLIARLKEQGADNITAVTVRVDEEPGQSAYYTTQISS
jgi:6-pyruvoyltetrahydropterin/6-carboxytetrahydropterin synthase